MRKLAIQHATQGRKPDMFLTPTVGVEVRREQYTSQATYTEEFCAMHQQPEEGVPMFLGRLKGVTTHCSYNRPDHMVRQRLLNDLIS